MNIRLGMERSFSKYYAPQRDESFNDGRGGVSECDGIVLRLKLTDSYDTHKCQVGGRGSGSFDS